MTKEIEKTEKRELTDAEARTELDNLKTAHKEYSLNKAKFYRACWRAHIYKLHRYFDGVRSEEELLETLGADKIGISTFREACRIYRQFLERVMTLPEFKGDKIAAEDYTEKLIGKAYGAVASNGSYLGEVARTKMIEGTKRESEDNIEDVKKIYHESKSHKDFTKAIKKKFGALNPDDVATRAKREAAKGGDKFMINARFDAALTPRITAGLEAISVSLGLRTKFADMNSDEIGTIISVMLQRLEKGTEPPKDLAGRRQYTVDRAREMIVGLTGVKFPDDVLNGVIEDFSTIVDPLAEKM
jgi:hypothetical protein